jgi:hypothetical protein
MSNIDLFSTAYRKYNWYYNCGTFTAETGQQNGTGNPFTNSAG